MERKNVIDAILNGDNAELAEIYSIYRKEFTLWALKKYNCPREEALEIYQASFFIFYNNIMTGKLRDMTSNLKTYLFAIGKNKILENYRRNTKYVFDAADEVFKIVDEQDYDVTSKESQYNQISRALEILGDPCRQILELVYYQNRSMDFITNSLGYKNVDSTKNQKYKCMQRLKKIIEGFKTTYESERKY